ncbi:MAG: FAD-linked oxidase C-terminal domain-containing protein [Gaiellaceae bacterium]
MAYLEREHGDLMPLMRGIKELLDPNGIMNPGKVIPAL